MEHAHRHAIIFIVYDGIENSVFQSQVLQPLLKRLQECPQTTITLLSFEQKNFLPERLTQLIPQHDRLNVIVHKRLPFIVPGSLWLAVVQLFINPLKSFETQLGGCSSGRAERKKAFVLRSPEGVSKDLSANQELYIIARGPIAGLIAQRAFKQHEILIQARGLCAEEYRYTHKDSSRLKKVLHWLRYQQFAWLEKRVYRGNTKIEAVSLALKEYLITTFGSRSENIAIASYDLPDEILPATVARWRHQARQELGIPQEAFVYCYSGSHKPWQCASESIAYVAQRYKENKNSFFLVLSQDAEKFNKELKASKLPQDRYCVLSVNPDKLFYYLSAADAGLLFRHKDVVNWVSRPTKVLEYQAVRLEVVHNNSVKMLNS